MYKYSFIYGKEQGKSSYLNNLIWFLDILNLREKILSKLIKIMLGNLEVRGAPSRCAII